MAIDGERGGPGEGIVPGRRDGPGGSGRAVPGSGPVAAELRVPPSKSLTQRALVCAALAPGTSILLTPLEAEDTAIMAEALRCLGVRIETAPGRWDVTGPGELFPVRHAELRLGNAGTAMRFLTPVVALGRGSFRLDGSERMRQRPIGDLLAALRALGVAARPVLREGFPPLEIEAKGLSGGEIAVRGGVSSQFLSGLLLAAPRAGAATTLRVDGPLVSRPYVRLTTEVMRRFGAAVTESTAADGSPSWRVGAGGYTPARFEIEGDASSACWWFAAAAVTGGRVRVRGVPRASAQGDLGLLDVLERMGCRVASGGQDAADAWIDVEGGPLRGVRADLSDMPDTAPALGAVALFAATPTRITGAAHLRAKESDRIAGLAAGLAALGARTEEHRDGLTITPGKARAATLDPLGDHRLAMAFAVAGLAIGGVRILDPGCVAKSYPGFFDDLERVARP